MFPSIGTQCSCKASANKIKILVSLIWTPHHLTYFGWTFAIKFFLGSITPKTSEMNFWISDIFGVIYPRKNFNCESSSEVCEMMGYSNQQYENLILFADAFCGCNTWYCNHSFNFKNNDQFMKFWTHLTKSLNINATLKPTLKNSWVYKSVNRTLPTVIPYVKMKGRKLLTKALEIRPIAMSKEAATNILRDPTQSNKMLPNTAEKNPTFRLSHVCKNDVFLMFW